MKSVLPQLVFFYIIVAILYVPVHIASADESFTVGTIANTATFRFNNENWFTEKHPKIATFTIQDDGSAYGVTESGVPFIQENIENELNIRIQRFVIEDHYHYIINGEVVYSFEDFSIQLAESYREQESTQNS